MKTYKLYFPYPSTRHDKKFMGLRSNGTWMHFGDKEYEHYTEGHLDEKRKQNYDKRNKGRDKDRYDYNSSGFWAYWYLWKYKTYEQAYKHIKRLILNEVLE